MINRIYLDTNIVADMIDISRAGHLKSLKLLEKLILNNWIIVISEDMLSTLYYISKDKSATLLFIQNVILVDWEVVSFGKETINKAINLALSEDLDLEDLLQCICAKENNCTHLLTNDKAFYDCGLSINSYEEFLSLKDK